MVNQELQKTLHDAIWQMDLDGVKKALAAGANPNRYNSSLDMRPPMVEAACKGFASCLEVLHQYGGLVDGPRAYHITTPLIGACVNGDLETSLWLVRHGADVMKTGRRGTSALEVAISHGVQPVAQMLVEEFPHLRGDLLTGAAERSIGMASACGTKMTQWLLNMGMSPNLMHYGDPWLMKLQTHMDAFGPSIELLLQAGAEVDLQNNLGRTALRSAVEERSVACFMRLLRAGADPDLPDNTGESVRQILEKDVDRANMLAAFKAWEASQAAHDLIHAGQAPAGIKPL